MANILERYGIKEVADVTFYDLNADGSPKRPVLYLDTLKVTTIEQTAEETEARGGKGNAALIAWDYGKEITVTIEDALFSAKSMAIMFGNGAVNDYSGANTCIMKSEQFIATGTGAVPTEGSSTLGWQAFYVGPDGTHEYMKRNPKFYDATGTVVTTLTDGDPYFCSYDLLVDGSVIEISANSFPGTYYVTGDTFARAEATGKDEFFQFVIPKAKVQSENTITLEAEGDPSVFNMNLKVLRPADGVMMKLIKYDLVGNDPAQGTQSVLYHNHYLDVNNVDETGERVDYTVVEGSTVKIPNPGAAGAATVTWTTTDENVATVEAGTGADIGKGIVTGADVSVDSIAVIVASWGDGHAVTYSVKVTANT